jgi:ribonuclease BN (tRNA processing enzyme)
MALAYDLPEDPGMEEELEFHTWQEIQQIGPFTVRTTPAIHPVPAYSIRVEHGNKSLVFTGDTGPNDGLIELARGADLLLSEAALKDDDPNNPVDLHLTPADAGEHAKRAGVKRLVITHVPPWFDRTVQAEGARRTFPGEVLVATPDATFEI